MSQSTFTFSKIENEKIISQIVGIGKNSDQDRVSKYDRSGHICSEKLKRGLVKYEKETLCLPFVTGFETQLVQVGSRSERQSKSAENKKQEHQNW